MKHTLFAIALTLLLSLGARAQQHIAMDGVELGRPFNDVFPELTSRLNASHLQQLDIPNRCFFYFYRQAQLVIYVTPKTNTVYRFERRYRVVTDDQNHFDMAYTKLYKYGMQYGEPRDLTRDNYPDRRWETPQGTAELKAIYVGGEYFILLTITDNAALKLLKKETGTEFLARDPRDDDPK